MTRIILLISALFLSFYVMAQSENVQTETKKSKAWEVGLGGTVLQFNRVGFTNFQKLDDKYIFDLKLRHAVYGGNIYVARELTKHLYFDIQGSLGFTKQNLSHTDNKNKMYFMVGGGFQWRFGEYFGSKYVDPYIRAGVSYMRKDFDVIYKENGGDESMGWVMDNIKNKDGLDRRDLMPISLGVGLNTWFSDRVGLGFQGDYVIMPYKSVANSLQGTVRLMVRFGGESKRPTQMVEYIERIVEKPVVVEKEVIVEVPVKVEKEGLDKMFDNLNFNFDTDELTPKSLETIGEIAKILKSDTSKRYLITGYSDAKGNANYNQKLSERRAKAVRSKLIDMGVPASMLKSRGVGSRVTVASPSSPNDVREGDRKITIEPITNLKYWDIIK